MTIRVLIADDQAMIRGVPDPMRVIVVTTFDLDEYVYGPLRGGAVGFILKDAGPMLLVEVWAWEHRIVETA